MKNYKEYEKIFIGESDISSLTVRFPDGVGVIKFGSDGSYSAYLVDGDAEIGGHYDQVLEINSSIWGEPWLWIFDDTGNKVKFSGKTIRVFRAGEMGCVIQVI